MQLIRERLGGDSNYVYLTTVFIRFPWRLRKWTYDRSRLDLEKKEVRDF